MRQSSAELLKTKALLLDSHADRAVDDHNPMCEQVRELEAIRVLCGQIASIAAEEIASLRGAGVTYEAGGPKKTPLRWIYLPAKEPIHPDAKPPRKDPPAETPDYL